MRERVVVIPEVPQASDVRPSESSLAGEPAFAMTVRCSRKWRRELPDRTLLPAAKGW